MESGLMKSSSTATATVQRSCLYPSLSNKFFPQFPFLHMSGFKHLKAFHASVLSLHFRNYNPFFSVLILKTIGCRAGLIKLRAHPPQSFPSQASLMETCCVFKDEDREPCLGRFLRKALTLLSKDSSGVSRCHHRCLINSGSAHRPVKTRRKVLSI